MSVYFPMFKNLENGPFGSKSANVVASAIFSLVDLNYYKTIYILPKTKTKMSDKVDFKKRISIEQVEEGTELAPKFDENGLLPCVTTSVKTGEV